MSLDKTNSWPRRADKQTVPANDADNGLLQFLEKADSASESLFSSIELCIEERPALALLGFFLVSLAVLLALTDFGVVRDGAYEYVVEGLNIARGDFAPLDFHANGWSWFLAPFIFLFGSAGFSQANLVAKLVADLVLAMSVIPLFYIAKSLLHGKSRVAALVLFVAFPPVLKWAGVPNPENLFMLFTLCMLYFMVRSASDAKYILAAAAFGSLSYFTRQNGLIALPILIVFFAVAFFRKMPKTQYFAYMALIAAVFLLVASPFLWQRYVEYGSPFSFNQVDNVFAEKEQWYDLAAPGHYPSFLEFLTTHSIKATYGRFIAEGLFRSVFYTFHQIVVVAILGLFFLVGLAARGLELRFLPFTLIIAATILGMSVVYPLVDAGDRYMLSAAPAVLVFISAGLSLVLGEENPGKQKNGPADGADGKGQKNILALAGEKLAGWVTKIPWEQKAGALATISALLGILFLAAHRAYLALLLAPFVLLFFGAAFIAIKYRKHYKSLFVYAMLSLCIAASFGFAYVDTYQLRNSASTLPHWSDWVAANVRGKIAAPYGPAIMMHFDDASMGLALKRANALAYSADGNLSVTMRPHFPDLESATRWYRENGASYILVFNGDSKGKLFGYFEDIYSENNPEIYEKVYDDSSDGERVKIFRIK